MRGLVLIITLSLFTNSLFGQKPNSQVEINPYFRWDSYPKFNYAINPVSTNTVKINGTSFGINASYKIPLKNKFFLKAGAGYYKFSFNKIKRINNTSRNSTARHTNITEPGTFFPFSTDRYYYNNFLINLAIEKGIDLNDKFQFLIGGSINNYFTYSQSYHLTPFNSTAEISNPYKTKRNQYFGFEAALSFCIQKYYPKFQIGPSLIVPVYKTWKTDEVFVGEKNNDNRRSWLNGVGIGISSIYQLSKK